MAQLFQFIWKTRYLLIWMGILLASMSLHSQSAEVLRLYWFDHRLNLKRAFWLGIGFAYSGFVFAAAATHIAIDRETRTLRAPRWIITVALATPLVIVLAAMILALAKWFGVGRALPTIAIGVAILAAALILLVLLIVWVERPKRVVAFSDWLGTVFSSTICKLVLDLVTLVFILGFLLGPLLLRSDEFVAIVITIGSLPTVLISLAIVMYVIHRLVTSQGNANWARVTLVAVGVLLLGLLANAIAQRSPVLLLVALAGMAGVVWEFRAPSYKAAIGVLLGLFAILLALGDIAPTTKVRTIRQSPPTSAPVLKAAFEDWVNSRADLEDYEGYKDADGKPKPYPVFIVAAQGGGLIAAYHAAMVLSHLQDLCPRFAQHVFAVSGVSGGSLGAAVFASAVDRLKTEQSRSPCDPKKESKEFRNYSERFLNRDFLSPLIFMAVIPTIAQRALSFLPNPVADWIARDIGVYDRARGLEYGFEAASNKSGRQIGAKPDFFQRGTLSNWQPKGIAPALVVSTTRADTGEPYWIAPFRMGKVEADSIIEDVEVVNMDFRQKVLAIENPMVDVRVSTAVGLSARFPFVTPPGTLNVVGHRWLEKQDRLVDRKYQTVGFVDGGYFENSGVESAWRLALAIKEERDKEERSAVRPVQIYILRVGEISGFRFSRFRTEYLRDMKWFPQKYDHRLPESDLTSPPGSELLAPLRALDASRQFRAWHGWLGTVANNRLINNNTATDIETVPDLFFGLTAETNPLPLGWQLTSETFSRILARQHRSRPEECVPSLKDEAVLTVEMNLLKAYGEDISAFVDRWNYGCAAGEIWNHLSLGLTTAAAR